MGPRLVNWKNELVRNFGVGESVGRRWGVCLEIIRWALRGGRGG